jgi:hypothetical protein
MQTCATDLGENLCVEQVALAQVQAWPHADAKSP